MPELFRLKIHIKMSSSLGPFAYIADSGLKDMERESEIKTECHRLTECHRFRPDHLLQRHLQLQANPLKQETML